MRKRTKTFIIAVVIFLLIVIFAIFFIKRDSFDPNDYVYNTFRVRKTPIGYSVLAYMGSQPYDLRLRYDPKNVENISLEGNVREKILSKPTLYLTLNPNLTGKSVIGAVEIANIISRKLGIYNIETIGAVTEYANDYTLVVTCENITANSNVLLLRVGNETRVYMEGECIVVQGEDEYEIARAADRLVYHILTVMP